MSATGLTLMSEKEAKTLSQQTSVTPELNIQDPDAVMTELIRFLVGHPEFHTMNADPSRWAMQGILVQTGTDNPYKMQTFINIGGYDRVFVQIELVHAPDKPQTLVKKNFNAKETLDMVRRLPYFPQYYQGMEA